MRVVSLAAGFVFVALGVIGIVLPLMPTTIFFILAAGAFARSSPRLEAKLLAHPRVGPAIRSWRERGAIAPRAKALAVGGMTIGFGVFLVSAGPGWPLALAVAAMIAAAALYVVSRPNP